MIAVPELGPLWMGHIFSAFTRSWDDACVLRREIEKSSQHVLKLRQSPA